MPRLFLHVRGNDWLAEDWEGADYETLEAARQDAIEGARQIMADRLRRGEELDGTVIEIVDQDGIVVAEVPFQEALAVRKFLRS